MSKVYSFRLNNDNPREIQAGEVINAWISKGYSLRQILTEALIRYRNNEDRGEEIDMLVKQLRELMNQSVNKVLQESVKDNDMEVLPSNFLDGIRKSMKSGVGTK
jgi:hypothetical protein